MDSEPEFRTRPKVTEPTGERRPSARCTVCRSPNRARIEADMAKGLGKRETATKYKLGEDSIWRHWHRHVPEAVKAARKVDYLKPGANLEKLLVEEPAGLLESLSLIRAGLLSQFDIALELDDRTGVAGMARELHRNLNLMAQATGELAQHAKSSVTNIILSPSYLALRANLLRALRPFPEAARAVAEALRQAEGDAMSAMMADAPTPVLIEETATEAQP